MKNIIRVIETFKKKHEDDELNIVCGYEAGCLAYGGYSAVHVPTEIDNSVKEFIRMRDDIHENLKRIKQQIIAFMTRNGKQFDGKSYWTKKHLDWIKSTSFNEVLLQDALK